MTPTSPYRSIPTRWQAVLCLVFALATLAYGSMLKKQGEPLTRVLAHGIVTLELPGTPAVAQRMVDALGGLVPVARRQVELDFVYLLLYPVALSLASALLAGVNGPRLGRLGTVLSWAVLLAAPLDATENLALLRLLDGPVVSPWPEVSTGCATLKFALVLAALAYLPLGAAGALRARQRKRAP